MPHEFQPVRPGDLITAQAWSDLLLKIEEIEQRLEALGNGGGGTHLAITGRIPANGPYRIGDTMGLLGGNFQFSLGAAQVFLNAVRALDLTGSTDTQLVFVIPPVPGVVEPGTEVTLRVLNQTAEVTQQIALRPALQATGEVDVTWMNVIPVIFEEGAQVTFAYRILSRASATADFAIAPFINVATGQSTWQSRVQVLDNSQNPIPGPVIRLAPLSQRLFNVRITQIPTGTLGTPFTLTLNAIAGAIHGTAGAQPFTVGEQAENPDLTIALNPRHVPGGAALEGDTVFFSPQGGGGPRLRFAAEFEVAGIYDLTVTATAGWTVVRAPATPAFYEILPQDVSAGRAVRVLEIDITPAGSLEGRTTVRLQRRGAANGRSFTLNLVNDVS